YYCPFYSLLRPGCFDAGLRQVFPAQIESNVQRLESELRVGRRDVSPVLSHHLVASQLLPALTPALRKAAQAQTAANQAFLACALERYRLQHGQFPESLNELTPQLLSRLPNDVVTGQPYKYHRKEQTFALYSVGWNQKDDAGTQGKTLFDEKNGDWVW